MRTSHAARFCRTSAARRTLRRRCAWRANCAQTAYSRLDRRYGGLIVTGGACETLQACKSLGQSVTCPIKTESQRGRPRRLPAVHDLQQSAVRCDEKLTAQAPYLASPKLCNGRGS